MLLTVLRGFEKIRRTSSRTRKTEIMEYLLKEKSMTRTILKYTYDPFFMYNMTSSVEFENPSVKAYHNAHGDDDKWRAMRSILDKLRGREVTGNKARRLVDEFLRNVDREISEVYSYWFMRILHKDLKIGLGVTTIEKLMPGLIPTFRIQKATVYEEGDVLPAHFAIEPKYDGLRGLVIVDSEGKATAFSSKGKPLYNLERILKEIESLRVRSVVFDGEFYGEDWNNTISTLQTETKVKNPDVKYYVFDLLTLEEWTKKKCKRNWLDRMYRRDRVLDSRKLKRVIDTGCLIAEAIDGDKAGVRTLKQEYKRLLAAGYEGAMIKDCNGHYVFKKSKAWMKYKPEHSCDLKIIGIQPGQGKLKGMVGAILCKGIAEWRGKEYEIRTKVGTGLSEKVRKKLQRLYDEGTLIGTIAEVKFQEVALKKKLRGGFYALRFPVYKRLRVDK